MATLNNQRVTWIWILVNHMDWLDRCLYSESDSLSHSSTSHIPTVGSFPFDLHGLPGAANHVPATCLGSVKNEQRAAALWIRGPMAHQKTTESADYWNIEVSGQKKAYWCLAGNEGMIHFITINNHPSNPHSNPSIPYVKRTSKKKTRGFLFGLLNQLPHQTWEMLLQLSRMGWYHGLRTQPNYGRISSSRHLTIEHVVNTIKKITLLNSKCGQYQQCVPKEINAYIGDIESLYYPKGVPK